MYPAVPSAAPRADGTKPSNQARAPAAAADPAATPAAAAATLATLPSTTSLPATTTLPATIVQARTRIPLPGTPSPRARKIIAQFSPTSSAPQTRLKAAELGVSSSLPSLPLSKRATVTLDYTTRTVPRPGHDSQQLQRVLERELRDVRAEVVEDRRRLAFVAAREDRGREKLDGDLAKEAALEGRLERVGLRQRHRMELEEEVLALREQVKELVTRSSRIAKRAGGRRPCGRRRRRRRRS